MLTLRRPRAGAGARPLRSAGRPVVLATLEVPFDPRAAAFAVDSAVEAGEPLIVVNAVEVLLAPAAIALGYGDVDDSPEDAAALAAPAALAHSLGVAVERLRVRSPHPVDALLEVVRERAPGLLVFGPDRGRMRPRTFRKACRVVRERAGCLLWLPD